MTKSFSVKIFLRDKEIETLRTEYKNTNESLIRRGRIPYASFEEYLGMIADAACRQRVAGILEADPSALGVEAPRPEIKNIKMQSNRGRSR